MKWFVVHRKEVRLEVSAFAAILAAMAFSLISASFAPEVFFPLAFAAAVLGARVWKRTRKSGLRYRLSSLLSLYSRSDAAAETLLAVRIQSLDTQALEESEQRWLERLKDLIRLRALLFGKRARGKERLRQGFAFSLVPAVDRNPSPFTESFSAQDVMESAIVVADLHWKLYQTCRGEYPELNVVARKLYREIWGVEFSERSGRERIMGLMDRMQRDQGIAFLSLNLMRQGLVNGDFSDARRIGAFLLTEDNVLEEEDRSALYWMAEILAFTKGPSPLASHEDTLRHLYHLCFTNPDRAGFLEIDSRFFAEFETVNEIAREGFLFRESLLAQILTIWSDYEGEFDPIFQHVLEAIAGSTNKVHDNRAAWDRYWKREEENFSREYLYVVEGNLSYAAGEFADAAESYEKALEFAPELRSALLNRVFAYARLEDHERHADAVQRLEADESLAPSSLYVAGNSFLLLGNEKAAESHYAVLRGLPGWEAKADFYKSTFCFENGLFESALRHARRAHALNPADTSVRYHLSRCYDALGMKDRALDLVRTIGQSAAWLNYYRFTLERDSGQEQEASQTLLRIPTEYFEDPEELEDALSFAKTRQDLALLRHLKKTSAK